MKARAYLPGEAWRSCSFPRGRIKYDYDRDGSAFGKLYGFFTRTSNPTGKRRQALRGGNGSANPRYSGVLKIHMTIHRVEDRVTLSSYRSCPSPRYGERGEVKLTPTDTTPQIARTPGRSARYAQAVLRTIRESTTRKKRLPAHIIAFICSLVIHLHLDIALK